MKKQTSIFAIFCISLFLYAPIANAGVAPTVTGWTWAEDLHSGSYFRWEVSMHNDTQGANTPVTTPGDDGPPFVDGSYMEVWVNDDPFGLNALNDIDNQLSNFFGFNFDGNNTLDPEIMPVLVFPNTYETTSGLYNYFHYIVDYNQNFTMFENENNDNESYYEFIDEGTNNEVFNATLEVFHDDGRYVVESFKHEVGTGVLRLFSHYEVYTDGTVLEASIALTVSEFAEGEDDFLRYAHFDASLNAGDSFTWDVISSKINGVNITTFSDGPPPPGTTVRIDIVGEPENINFSEEVDGEDYFEFYIDDVQYLLNETFEGPGDFIQFIFPKNFDFENGTTLDFFEYAAANPSEVFNNENETSSATLSNGLFTLNIEETWDDGSSSQVIVFDASNGVMQYLKRHEERTENNVPQSVEFELVLQGFTDIPTTPTSSSTPTGDDNSSEANLPLPGFTFYMLLSAFIAVPMVRRKL